MFCYALLCVHSSFAIFLMGKRELVALLSLSSWCLVIVVWLFLVVLRVCLRFVIVVFPDHTDLPFFSSKCRLSHDIQVISKPYITFYYFIELITKIRFSNNSFEFIN